MLTSSTNRRVDTWILNIKCLTVNKKISKQQGNITHISDLEIFIKLDLAITVGIELIEEFVNLFARDNLALFLK